MMKCANAGKFTHHMNASHEYDRGHDRKLQSQTKWLEYVDG